MPDPSLPPLIITFSTPRTPQPYQERFLAALEEWNDAIAVLKEGLLVIGRNTNGITGSLSFLARHYRRQPPAWRLMPWRAGPTIGRKRRARRARGRRRGNA